MAAVTTRAVAAVMVVAMSGCSFAMRAHDDNDPIPVCTDSLLPVIADGAMTVAAGAVAAGHIYARRNDRAYCGPDANGAIPVDGCGYDQEGAIGAPFVLVASASLLVGAIRHGECRAAYERAELRHPGAPIERRGVSLPLRLVAYSSFIVDALFGVLASSLFSR